MLDGAITFITGAASGIGEACALAFARAGAKVGLSDLAGDAVQALAERIRADGGDAVAVAADVSDRGQVEAAVAATVERFGGLTSAINAAGIASPGAAVGDLPDRDWQRQITINLSGTFYSMQAEIAAIRQRGGGGSIVNIASGAGLKGIPSLGDYAAAKHGVLGLTKSAALDHARETIRINAICPGYIETPIHDRRKDEGRPWDITALVPLGRPGRADEIADAAIWLVSAQSSFVTGIALPVDGGYAAM